LIERRVRPADQVLVRIGGQRDRDHVADIQCPHHGGLDRQRCLRLVVEL
jgi:hypothetical protein